MFKLGASVEKTFRANIVFWTKDEFHLYSQDAVVCFVVYFHDRMKMKMSHRKACRRARRAKCCNRKRRGGERSARSANGASEDGERTSWHTVECNEWVNTKRFSMLKYSRFNFCSSRYLNSEEYHFDSSQTAWTYVNSGSQLFLKSSKSEFRHFGKLKKWT